MSNGNKRLDDYFPKSLVGLDLLENPNKCRRSGFSFQVTEPASVFKTTYQTPLDTYSKLIRERLTNFQVPLRSYDRSDPIMVLLEAGYYHYRATHPTQTEGSKNTDTSNTEVVGTDTSNTGNGNVDVTNVTREDRVNTDGGNDLNL